MSVAHYTDHEGIEKSIIGFCTYCRHHKLGIGINHTKEALQAAKSGFIQDTTTFKFALRALFCTCQEEQPTFERLFDIYWRKKRHDYQPRTTRKNQLNMARPSKGSVVMMGFGQNKDQKEQEAKNVSGANKMEVLRKTDFSKISSMDTKLLDELARKLLEQMNVRLKRRLQMSKKGRIDIRRTIRRNIGTGDDLFQLVKKNRKLDKYRLIVLLDVSGSMDKYSFFLLKFIWSLKANFKNIEAFIFSTKIIRITDYLDKSNLEATLSLMSENTDNWSSGTKIGACLLKFNELYAKRILNGKSMTIILSDGLDTGDTNQLAMQLKKIRMRTNRLVWLNPLKGMEGYEPIAKGMKAALPEVDTFRSAHNLDSLLELEKILTSV